jgi:hypothetical protein
MLMTTSHSRRLMINYCPTEDLQVDILTKALSKIKFIYL